jgi:endoglucanase
MLHKKTFMPNKIVFSVFLRVNALLNSKKTKKFFLFFLSLLFALASFSQFVTDRIKVNQLGYYTNAPKVAVVTGSTDAQTFYITSTNIRDTLFTGKLSEEKQSTNSSTKTRIADFSSLRTNGTFFVLIPWCWPFLCL